MNEDTLNNLEQLFLALSDKTRLSLLGLMSGGEVPVGVLADSLGVSQPKISRHLAYLRNAGLVSTRRDGKWVYYAIEMPSDPAACHVLAETLRSLGGYAAAPIVTRGFPDMQEPFADEYVPQEIEIFLL